MINITSIEELRPVSLPSERIAYADDGFLVAMADSEFNFLIQQARAMFDFTCGMAVDLYGHGSKQHCAAIDRARTEFNRARSAAVIARNCRVDELRAAIRRASPNMRVVA